VLVTENTNVLLCLAAGGERAWSTVLGGKSRLVPEGVASSRPVVADLTGDGRNEVAIGCFAGALVMIEAKSGDVLERTRYGVESHERHLAGGRVPGFMRELLLSTGEPISELRAVDLDGRPGCELVFGCSDGSVYATSPRTGLRMWASGVEATVYEACIPFPPADAEAPALIAWDVKGVYLMCGADGRRLSGLPPIEGASCVLAGDLKGDGSLDIVVLERGGRTAGAWTTDVAVSAARSLSGGVNDAGASVHLSTPARQR
jgi:hypothetical protein